MENIKDTTYDFVLVLRQMFTEKILREKLTKFGVEYYQGIECVDFTLNESTSLDDYPVTSKFVEKATGKGFELKRFVMPDQLVLCSGSDLSSKQISYRSRRWAKFCSSTCGDSIRRRQVRRSMDPNRRAH